MRLKSIKAIILIALMTVAFDATVVFAQQGPIPAIVNGGRLDRRLLVYQSVTLTNAQVLALNSTPVTIVPAQGANTFIELISGVASYVYGTAVYNINGGRDLALFYTSRAAGPQASATIGSAGLLDQTASGVRYFSGVTTSEMLTVNAAIVLTTLVAANPGTGSATNSLTIRVAYRVHNR